MDNHEFQVRWQFGSEPDREPDNAFMQMAEEETPSITPVDEEFIEEDDTFSLDKFQVVRREFFSHISEPSITFNNYKIGFNSACIKRLPQIDYIQFLVNRQTQKLAIRPCRESDLHSFQWCSVSGGKRKPRQVTGKIFFMKLFAMMGWNPDYRYKILGKLIRANGEYLFVFDLNSTEMYQRIIKEGAKPKTSRTPVFPAEWQDQFGVPYEEHRKSLQINIFDNYAVYGIKDKEAETPVPIKAPESQTTQLQLPPSPAPTGGNPTWQR